MKKQRNKELEGLREIHLSVFLPPRLCVSVSMWLIVLIHKNFNFLPPVESLPPPQDFPARLNRRDLRPGTRRGLRGASLWRCGSWAIIRRNRFFQDAAVCPVPSRPVLSTLLPVGRLR